MNIITIKFVQSEIAFLKKKQQKFMTNKKADSINYCKL